MATFEKATLVLVPDDESQTARVEVSCEVHYQDEEVASMRQNPEQTFFSLFCTLVGRDAGTVAPLDTDDWLYTFATQSLPAGPPAASETVRFETTLGYNVLNEDIIGADEIYADLILRGWLAFKEIRQRSRTNLVRFTSPVKMR